MCTSNVSCALQKDSKSLTDIGSGSGSVGLSNLTAPITWSTQTDEDEPDAKTGGSDTGNNIGFDNSNDFYVKMAANDSKMIVRNSGGEIIEFRNSVNTWKRILPIATENVFPDLGDASHYWGVLHVDTVRFEGRGDGDTHIAVDNSNDMEFSVEDDDDKFIFKGDNKTILEMAEDGGLTIYRSISHGDGSISIGTVANPFPIGSFNQVIGGQYIHTKGAITFDGLSEKSAYVEGNGGRGFWAEGTNLWMRSGGNDVNMSTLGSGGGGTPTIADNSITLAKIAADTGDNNKYLQVVNGEPTWSAGSTVALPAGPSFDSVTVTNQFKHTGNGFGVFNSFTSGQQVIQKLQSGQRTYATRTLAEKIGQIYNALNAYGFVRLTEFS